MRSSCLIAIAGWCGVMIACASAQKTSPAMAPPQAVQTDPTNVLPADPREEIERLEAEIATKRGELGFGTEPAMTVPQGTQTMSAGNVPKSSDATCKHGGGDTCESVCTLSDSICENAGKICDLSQKLGDDAWAKGKCETATNSCAEAMKKCCDCQ